MLQALTVPEKENYENQIEPAGKSTKNKQTKEQPKSQLEENKEGACSRNTAKRRADIRQISVRPRLVPRKQAAVKSA